MFFFILPGLNIFSVIFRHNLQLQKSATNAQIVTVYPDHEASYKYRMDNYLWISFVKKIFKDRPISTGYLVLLFSVNKHIKNANSACIKQ